VASVADREIAPTAHDVIFGRIDSLQPELYAVLVSITVAPAGCRADVLSHLHGISRLHAAMLGDELVDRRLAVENDGVYRCAHPAIASVVSARITTSRRFEVERALEMVSEMVAAPPGRAERAELKISKEPMSLSSRGA